MKPTDTDALICLASALESGSFRFPNKAREQRTAIRQWLVKDKGLPSFFVGGLSYRELLNAHQNGSKPLRKQWRKLQKKLRKYE